MQFKENQTIYLQIAERISDEILLGHYAIGSRIPSVREYAALVEVNANTVMRSYEFLQTQGIIFNKRGIGFFVSPDANNQGAAYLPSGKSAGYPFRWLSRLSAEAGRRVRNLRPHA